MEWTNVKSAMPPEESKCLLVKGIVQMWAWQIDENLPDGISICIEFYSLIDCVRFWSSRYNYNLKNAHILNVYGEEHTREYPTTIKPEDLRSKYNIGKRDIEKRIPKSLFKFSGSDIKEWIKIE